ATMRTGVAEGEWPAIAIAANEQCSLQKHDFFHAIAPKLIAGKSPVPEIEQHERVRGLRMRKFTVHGTQARVLQGAEPLKAVRLYRKPRAMAAGAEPWLC